MLLSLQRDVHAQCFWKVCKPQATAWGAAGCNGSVRPDNGSLIVVGCVGATAWQTNLLDAPTNQAALLGECAFDGTPTMRLLNGSDPCNTSKSSMFHLNNTCSNVPSSVLDPSIVSIAVTCVVTDSPSMFALGLITFGPIMGLVFISCLLEKRVSQAEAARNAAKAKSESAPGTGMAPTATLLERSS
jgi:hypothetical protein